MQHVVGLNLAAPLQPLSTELSAVLSHLADFSLENISRQLRQAICRPQASPGVLPDEAIITFMRFYRDLLRPQDRPLILSMLCSEFGLQPAELNKAVEGWQKVQANLTSGGQEALFRAAERVKQTAQPLYTQLLVPISHQPQGTTFLDVS